MKEQELISFEEMFPVWNKLTLNQKEQLKRSLTVHNFPKGTRLHSDASDCSGLFLVKKGVLRAFILSEAGKEITLYRLFERDICLFSASCMMKNINFDIHITAEKDTAAFLIPTAVYQSLMEQSLSVADFTNQIMASRFSDVMWVMEQVLFSSFDKRLAAFLQEQSLIDGSDTLEITHEEIARHLGSAREVVTRMLQYFQSEGMVKLFRGGIILLNKERLNQSVQSEES